SAAPVMLVGGGQGEAEHRADARPGLGPEPAAVHLDQSRGDVQAEAGAAGAADLLAVHPVELLEQLPHVAWAHPDSLVPTAHLNRVAVVVAGVEDRAAPGGVFERIPDQVGEYLLDLVRVAPDDRQADHVHAVHDPAPGRRWGPRRPPPAPFGRSGWARGAGPGACG